MKHGQAETPNWYHTLLSRAWQFRSELLTISALALLVSAATLALPWLATQALGDLLSGQMEAETSSRSPATVPLLIGVLIAMTLLNIAAAIATEYASGRILAALRGEVHAHVQYLSLAFHDANRSGDVLALLTQETGDLAEFLSGTLANLPSMIVTAGGAALILFYLDPAMALIVPIVVPVFFVLIKLFGRRLRVIASEVRAAEADVVAYAESDLAMLPAIKAFATESAQQDRYQYAVEKARKLAFRETRISAFVGPVVALIAALSAIGILLYGSDSLSDGVRTPAELFAFLLYAALLTRPVGQIANLYGQLQLARGALTRLEGVLNNSIEAGYGVTSGPAWRAKGAIAFENVHFQYPGREPVLEGASLVVDQGEIVALTGDNGVGKSTLIRLLMRFYEVDEGRITLDGKDITQFGVQSLRQQFGYVPQRALLFNGTVKANIAFGVEKPDSGRLMKAIELAQAQSLIDGLPAGLETEIGDNGVRLSGGQRQRIALARALYRDPPIYILDEATSMYDLESEAAFVESCIQALKGRTVILITHRPASLALADRILEVTPRGFEEVSR